MTVAKFSGSLHTNDGPKPVKFAKIDAAASSTTSIVSAVSGKKIRVIAFAVSGNGGVTINFESGTTDITGVMNLASGVPLALACEQGLFETAKGAALQITEGTGATVDGFVVYVETI